MAAKNQRINGNIVPILGHVGQPKRVFNTHSGNYLMQNPREGPFKIEKDLT